MRAESQTTKIIKTVIAVPLSIAGGFIIGSVIILSLWSDATTMVEYWLANLVPTLVLLLWTAKKIWRPKRSE